MGKRKRERMFALDTHRRKPDFLHQKPIVKRSGSCSLESGGEASGTETCAHQMADPNES